MSHVGSYKYIHKYLKQFQQVEVDDRIFQLATDPANNGLVRDKILDISHSSVG